WAKRQRSALERAIRSWDGLSVDVSGGCKAARSDEPRLASPSSGYRRHTVLGRRVLPPAEGCGPTARNRLRDPMLQATRTVRIRLFGRPHLTEDAEPITFKAPA